MWTLRSFVTSLLLISAMSSSAQSFNANSKTSGILIGNNFKLEGTLDINMEQDQVLWSYDNQLKIFSAAQIKEIIIEGMPAYLSESLHDEKTCLKYWLLDK